MATLQVKGIDDRLYKALGARASLNNRSISQEVITIIQECLSRPPADPRAATLAFLELSGSWKDERSAARIAADLRRARRSRKKRNVFD